VLGLVFICQRTMMLKEKPHARRGLKSAISRKSLLQHNTGDVDGIMNKIATSSTSLLFTDKWFHVEQTWNRAPGASQKQ
jgi:hypothetical protein